MNTTDKQFLSNDSLFLKVPNDKIERCSVDTLLDGIKASIPYGQLIDLTYYILKDNVISISELLQIWEIRLILHLFDNQLAFAKKEAINLNNALYLNENNNIAPAQAQPQSTGSNSNSNSRTNSMVSTSGSAANSNSNLQPIYPLPKNNNGLIGYSLLILILRLRSIPNLSLVNELYKLCYQVRLRSSGTDDEKQSLTLKLINLSYDITVILSITKNYHTLLNYLESIRYELVLQKKHDQLTDVYRQYLSNITLLWLITVIMMHVRNGTKKDRLIDVISKNYQLAFDEDVNEESLNGLLYVLSNILPIPSSDQMAKLPEDKLTVPALVSLVQQGDISGRILCSTMGLWDICNLHGFSLTGEDKLCLTRTARDLADIVSSCYDELTNDWSNFIHKVYGLE